MLYKERMNIYHKKAFSMVQARQLLKSIVDNKKLAHEHYDGCNSRAHIIANFIHKKGFRTQKIWLSGNLTDPINQKMDWCFHVAVGIFVKQHDQEILMVLDPSLEKTKLLTVAEWLKLNNVHYLPPLISFPIPRTVGLFFDVVLSYSSHIPHEPYYDDTNVALTDSLKEAHAINKEQRVYLKTLETL